MSKIYRRDRRERERERERERVREREREMVKEEEHTFVFCQLSSSPSLLVVHCTTDKLLKRDHKS